MEGYPPGSIWPTTDVDQAQIREVYARYGLAMYTTQVLEHGIVNALFVLRVLPIRDSFTDQRAWEAEFNRFYDGELAKTFGNMVRALEDLQLLPAPLFDRLRDVKIKRDHLAHRFFREHDLDFMSKEGRVKMIAECESAIEDFKALDQEIEALTDVQRRQFGITPEWIDRQIALMEAKAQVRDDEPSSLPDDGD